MIQLNPRERQLLIGLGLFALVFGIYTQMIRPVRTEVESLSETLPQKQQELVQVTDKASALDSLTQQRQQLQDRIRQQGRKELMPYVDELLRRFDLEPFVTDRKPLDSLYLTQTIEENRIEIRWENIVFKDLLNFLAVIDAPENLCRIQSLNIQHNSEETSRVNASVTIARPQLVKG